MIRATLRSTTWLSPDVRAITLQPHRTFAFTPGQYVGVGMRGGPSRCYSMARAPAPDNSIELHIRRWPGGAFSDRVMRGAAVGDEFDLTGPLGGFAYPAGQGPVVMLATGTGVAPLMAMLEAALPTSATRPIRLFWGVRSVSDLYARDTLNAWQSRFPHFRFMAVVSSLEQGRVQDVARRAIIEPSSTHVLACGSPAMVDDAYRCLVSDAAVPVATFDSDAFEPAADANLVARASSMSSVPSASVSGADTVPTVELSINGQRMRGRCGDSVLTALRQAGQPVMSVCGGKASCGTCVVSIDPEWSQHIEPPTRTERNLLACLPGLDPGSRLGCQIQLIPALDGLALRVPLLTSR